MAGGPIIQSNDLEGTFRALRNQDPAKLRGKSVPYTPDYKQVPHQNYAPSATVHAAGSGMNRYAGASGSAGMIYGQPQFFSPVHTPINWQIPSKRLEIYQWCRFFYENEPKIAASIDFYSYFPMNGFDNECKDREVKKYFDKLKERLDLSKWLRLVSHEVHLLGDCFPFIEISCESCGGSGKIGDQLCEHDGGTARRIVILNPDYVEVYTDPINPDPVIALKPDESLINMVQKKTPGYERLTPEVRALVSAGRPIPLDNRNIFHLKYGEGGYSRYGVGMVRRLFPILSYKTKLMVAQWIVAERLIIPIRVVKVGNDERPAGPADIASVQEQLAQTANDPNLTIVTHNAFDLEWYGSCYDDKTEVLTENGWKSYFDVSKNFDEKIATYNLSNNQIEYQIPQEYHEYDYNGELCSFESKHYSIAVTPNHKMLTSIRKWNNKINKYDHSEWKDVRSDNVIENSRFKCCAEWQGIIPEDLPFKKEMFLSKLSLNDYLEFVGFYLSEGGLKIDKGVINAMSLSQKESSPYFLSIRNSIYKVSEKIQEYEDTRTDPPCWLLTINNSAFAREIAVNYGKSSLEKKIPKWILNLPRKELTIILNALMAGDGSVSFANSGKQKYKYTTVSLQLANDIQEIVFKLGYNPKIGKYKPLFENRNDVYNVCWSDGVKERGFVAVKDRNIGRMQYDGKVWCFTVPNGYFVTRRNCKITIQGNSGKVLTLSNEFELINQEILDGMMINNALLNGEGPSFCHSDDTRILTNNGLKYRIELDIEKDLIATFNKKTGALEYQKAIKKWEYNYNSIDGEDKPLKHFLTNRMDILVTPNHKMLYAPRKCITGPRGQKVDGQKESFGEWESINAEEVKQRGKFRACIDKWDGLTEEKDEYFGIKKEDFIQIVGWYISEGSRHIDNQRHGKIYSVDIAQSHTENPDVYAKMKKVLSANNICKIYPSSKNSFAISNTDNSNLVSYLVENCGQLSNQKKIPNEIKNMSVDSLKTLLAALVECDGSERPATVKFSTDKKYYTYFTVSTQLRDDVIEILFKLGFSPRFSTNRFDNPNLQTIYHINWTDTNLGKFPVLDSRKWNGPNLPQSKKQVILEEDYIGKVWCVEVPNHFIITERNGLFGIHGNSNAAVGIEAMIERLQTFRKEVSNWVEQKIYLPEAKRQGFIDKDADSEEDEYIYPRIKWHSMHLRDQQQHRTFVLQLYEKGLLSAQTVLETFDFDPDQEIERKRYDAVQMMALGQGMGEMGMQAPGGGGDAGGGMGGGFGGMPPMPGGGGEGGMPGMEGGGAPGAEAPISAPAGGAPPAMSTSKVKFATNLNTTDIANPTNYGGKILKEKTRSRIDMDKQKMFQQQQKASQQETDPSTLPGMRDAKGRIIFTDIEMELMKRLSEYRKNGLIKYPILPQFAVKFGSVEYPIDFALPHLKLGIEADGEIFHSSPKQLAHDKERDMKLAQAGWTILRFKDEEIEKRLERVMSTIVKTIMQKESLLNRQKESLK